MFFNFFISLLCVCLTALAHVQTGKITYSSLTSVWYLVPSVSFVRINASWEVQNSFNYFCVNHYTAQSYHLISLLTCTTLTNTTIYFLSLEAAGSLAVQRNTTLCRLVIYQHSYARFWCLQTRTLLPAKSLPFWWHELLLVTAYVCS